MLTRRASQSHLPTEGGLASDLNEEKRPWAAVEIAPTAKGQLPATLVRWAYRASQIGVVALVLNGIDARDVNRVLDPLVPLLPLTIPGVIYLHMDDDPRVQEAILSAQLVFAATRPFRAYVLALGIDRSRVWPVSSALALLGSDAAMCSAFTPVRFFRGSNDPVRRKPSCPVMADFGRQRAVAPPRKTSRTRSDRALRSGRSSWALASASSVLCQRTTDCRFNPGVDPGSRTVLPPASAIPRSDQPGRVCLPRLIACPTSATSNLRLTPKFPATAISNATVASIHGATCGNNSDWLR